MTGRIWSLEEVEGQPAQEVEATLAELRATLHSLDDQRQLSKASLDEAYGAISASWRLLRMVRGQPDLQMPVAPTLEELEELQEREE